VGGHLHFLAGHGGTAVIGVHGQSQRAVVVTSIVGGGGGKKRWWWEEKSGCVW